MEMLEKIERYSKGKMTAEEKQAFESEISNNEELKEQLELSFLIDEIIIVNETWKLREQMQLDLNKPKKFYGKYILAILFLVSVVTGIVLTFLPDQKSKTEEKVIDKNNEEQKLIKIEAPVTDKTFSGIIKEKQKENVKVESKNIQTLEVNAQKTEPKVPAIKQDSITTFKIPENQQQVLNIIKPEPSFNTPVSDSCKGLNGEVEYFINPSCKDENTGEIIIDSRSVQGGTKPFSFTIGNNVSTSRFDHLAAGKYNLIITDALGCVAKRSQSIIVTEKICKSDQHIFNPQYDNYWSIPYNKSKTPVNFTIYDQNGMVLFSSAVQDFLPAEWRGELNRGGEIGIGLYLFTIEYADGTFQKGSITITK